MLGSWFSADHKATRRSTEPTSPKHTSKSGGVDSTLLTSPHDDILAELYGLRTEAETSAAKVNTGNIPEVNVNVDGEVGQDSPPPESTTYASTSASASTPISKLYDPFSGTVLGVLTTPEHDVNLFADAGATKDEELWSHLTEILRLQSDIAETHLQMEDFGAKEKMGARDWTAGEETGEGGDEDEGMEGDEEVRGEKARKEKFAKLADTFIGRRQKIDKVMGKLGDLSRALTTFHALRTPIFDLPRSSTHPHSQNTRPPAQTSMSSDANSKPPPFSKTHSTPQLSHTRPQPMHSHSQPGSPSSGVPSLGVQRPRGILQQSVVDSPLSMVGTLPDE